MSPSTNPTKEITMGESKSIAEIIDLIYRGVEISSLDIAQATGKRHHHVLDDIDKALAFHKDETSSHEISLLFQLSEYKAKNGKRNRMFMIKKKGVLIILPAYSFEARLAIADKLDELEQQIFEYERRVKRRRQTRDQYNPMIDALRKIRKEQGKDTLRHHEQNEARLVFHAVTGTTPSKYKGTRGLTGFQPRDYLPKKDLEDLYFSQEVNKKLILEGKSYKERKELLSKIIEITKS